MLAHSVKALRNIDSSCVFIGVLLILLDVFQIAVTDIIELRLWSHDAFDSNHALEIYSVYKFLAGVHRGVKAPALSIF